jgi:hypothetical protein
MPGLVYFEGDHNGLRRECSGFTLPTPTEQDQLRPKILIVAGERVRHGPHEQHDQNDGNAVKKEAPLPGLNRRILRLAD